jgi:hypothetical protein
MKRAALQTLRAVRKRPAVAKRLDCGRFSAAFWVRVMCNPRGADNVRQEIKRGHPATESCKRWLWTNRSLRPKAAVKRAVLQTLCAVRNPLAVASALAQMPG